MISQKDRKWRLVTDNPIVLDFSGCRYADEIHAAIKDAFGFPVITARIGTPSGIACAILL